MWIHMRGGPSRWGGGGRWTGLDAPAGRPPDVHKMVHTDVHTDVYNMVCMDAHTCVCMIVYNLDAGTVQFSC